MLRDQIINFLEAAVIFLLLTNALTAAAATWAIRMMKIVVPGMPGASSAIERKIDAMLRRAA
jgi:hypothetical protein